MTNVKNNRRDRPVDVRGQHPDNPEGTKIYRIPPGATLNVPGFDAKRPFNRALADEGDITIGGRGVEKDNDDDRKKQLQADLEAAQTRYKQAKDKAEKAQADVKADATDENKKAFGLAKAALKEADEDVGKAQNAFDKG